MTWKPNVRIDAPLRSVLCSLVAGVLASQAVHASEPAKKPAKPAKASATQCPSAPPADPRLDELRKADPNDTRIDVNSDSGELGRDGDATLHGNVDIRTGQKLLKADEADIDGAPIAGARSRSLRTACRNRR